MKKDILEKAKWQIGEVRIDGKGVAHECYGYDNNGKAQIRRVKKQHTSAAQPSATPKTSVTKPDSKTVNTQTDDTKLQPKKSSAPYDAPKPKVTYNNRPAAEIEVKVQVPENFKLRDQSGKIKNAERSTYRKAYSGMDEKKLLKLLNNPKNAWEIRMLAWEEAQARGIDESKIDISGSLKRKWDKEKNEYDLLNKKTNIDDDEVYSSVNNAILDTFDVEEAKSKFPDGDKGWMNEEDKRIQSLFGGLETKLQRQQYDAFLDMMKREDPYYENWQEKLHDLGRDYLMFIKNPNTSVFVSTGGAGAGKSYTLQKVFELEEKIPYSGGNPKDDDYDYVMLPSDIDDEKDFSKILHDYNGKIIVFDDKDKLLTTRSAKLVNMMKALGDTNKKLRKFKNPEGKEELFTGKLLFISNKSKETLNKNEDMVAVMSRATKNDIHYTVNENLEVLANRYMTMEPNAMYEILADDPKLEKEYRQKAFDIIMDMSDKLDPMNFTVRKFNDIMIDLNSDYAVRKMNDINEDFANYIGTGKDFERIVVTALEKSIGNEKDYFEKAVFKEEYDSLTDSQKEVYKKLYKKNPEKFAELFGLDIIDIINGKKEAVDKSKKKTDDEVKKAFENELGDMTIQEAENILLG